MTGWSPDTGEQDSVSSGGLATFRCFSPDFLIFPQARNLHLLLVGVGDGEVRNRLRRLFVRPPSCWLLNSIRFYTSIPIFFFLKQFVIKIPNMQRSRKGLTASTPSRTGNVLVPLFTTSLV